MSVEEFYDKLDWNCETVVGRFLGNKDMVTRFLKKFLADQNYENLVAAVADEDYDKMLMAAHSLKGVCGNLDLQPLYKESSTIVEAIRSDQKDKILPAFEQLRTDYQRIVQMIEEL